MIRKRLRPSLGGRGGRTLHTERGHAWPQIRYQDVAGRCGRVAGAHALLGNDKQHQYMQNQGSNKGIQRAASNIQMQIRISRWRNFPGKLISVNFGVHRYMLHGQWTDGRAGSGRICLHHVYRRHRGRTSGIQERPCYVAQYRHGAGRAD
jgi:hypothetical protein